VRTFVIGLTDHLEGPRGQPSVRIFDEVADLIRLADQLGVQYAWFSEHHAHAHFEHMPTPLLYALHLASQTQNIRLGTAIICLNLHHPLDIAEQIAVADILTNGRMAVGFGSGSTPEEFGLFGLSETDDHERHARFEEALGLIRSAWNGTITGRESAWVEPALRTLWRRFRQEGKIRAETPEPARSQDLCGHPINFIVGGPESVARQLHELCVQAPFDVANVEVRWAELPHELVCDSLRRLMEDVMPIFHRGRPRSVETFDQ
jgi:hypothetical protein